MNALTEAFSRSETGSHPVARSDLLISCRGGPLEQVLLRGGLYAVFQPIVHLGQAHVYAHEALIRGPRGSPLHTPDALLRAAAEEGLGFEFEYACVRVALQTWAQCKTPGRLFINLSAGALMQLSEQSESLGILQRLQDIGLTPRMLVIEITEHERVVDMDQLGSVVHKMRAMGIALALDDFGDGRSSLRLWSQLKPEVVKIDKYFTKDISAHGDKLKTLQALQQIAILFGSELVAEGIETAHDLRVLRDFGMDYGQGYYLGHPASEPLRNPGVDTERVLKERQVVVFPELSRVEASGQLRHLSLVTAPTVSDSTTVDEVARIFMADLSLHAVAVLADGKPVGIVNRSKFMNEYTKLYYREIWGRRSCAVHTNYAPRIIEREHCISDLIGILTSQDQRYLSDGFIVTENGRYIGLGTGDQLVRSVTESRVEAARHANPLTFLPGNIPISQHIDRLLKKQVSFVACYADLNHFKPFNDYYGYWRGD